MESQPIDFKQYQNNKKNRKMWIRLIIYIVVVTATIFYVIHSFSEPIQQTPEKIQEFEIDTLTTSQN